MRFAAPALLLVVLGAVLLSQQFNAETPEQRSALVAPLAPDVVAILDAKAAQLEPTTFDGVAVGGVVPHDILHGEYVLHYLHLIAEQAPGVILLIVPDHKEAGTAPMTTTAASWQTQFGIVEADGDMVDALAAALPSVVRKDDAVAQDEHALYYTIPLIRSVLPEAAIVPLALKVGLSEPLLKDVAATLDALLPKDALILASIDFSHYLPAAQTAAHDALSREALLSGSEDFFLGLGRDFNDYVDSPSSMALFLMLMDVRGAPNATVFASTNSGILAGNPELGATGYLEMVYTK